MIDYFYKLKPSTQLYLIGLITSFMGLLTFNHENVESIILVRFIAFVNVIFAIMAIVAIFCLFIGAGKSFKEIKENRQENNLENIVWYRFVKVLGYLSYPIAIIYILNSDWVGQKFIVFAIYIFIFFARFIKSIFLYIVQSPNKNK
ncbi:MAG: hypothetical protein NTW46_01505 [Candidatus Nealsonbacteria bacterium]|nr:hypothetical protein [Candidatus Nealsonbacteria bacterium]